MKKKSMKQYYDEYCIRYDFYQHNYDLIFMDDLEEIILLCHKECGNIFKKTKNQYKTTPFCTNNACIEKRKKENSIEKYGVDTPQKLFFIKEKIKQTNLKRYGCNASSQNEGVKMKMANTCFAKYGAKTQLQNEDVKQKIKQTKN